MPQPQSQTRSLGLGRATSLVLSNIIGSGILMLPASLGLYGSLGLIGWLITAVGAICLALVFGRLAKRFPKTGGPYTYSREAFGDFIGFQMAWSYWVGTWAGNAAMATVFVAYMSTLFPILATDIVLAFMVAIGSVWFFTLVNLAGVRSAGIMQVFATIVKIVPLLIIGVFGISHINFDHFFPLNPSGQPTLLALGSAAALALYAFIGIESATIPADNVINPTKTIPRATILGALIATFIYIWFMVVVLGVLPPETLAQSHAPFVDVGRVIFGNWVAPIIGISAAASAFMSLNGWILLQGQIPLAAAQDGLFPKFFMISSKNGTPVVALIISSVFMTVMLLMNYQASLVEQFTVIVIFTTFTMLLPYLYSSIGELIYLLNNPNDMSKMAFFRAAGTTLISFLYALAMVAGTGHRAVYWGMMFIFAGFPLYAWMKREHLRNTFKKEA